MLYYHYYDPIVQYVSLPDCFRALEKLAVAPERRGNNLKHFMGFYLKVKALTVVCVPHSLANDHGVETRIGRMVHGRCVLLPTLKTDPDLQGHLAHKKQRPLRTPQ